MRREVVVVLLLPRRRDLVVRGELPPGAGADVFAHDGDAEADLFDKRGAAAAAPAARVRLFGAAQELVLGAVFRVVLGEIERQRAHRHVDVGGVALAGDARDVLEKVGDDNHRCRPVPVRHLHGGHHVGAAGVLVVKRLAGRVLVRLHHLCALRARHLLRLLPQRAPLDECRPLRGRHAL